MNAGAGDASSVQRAAEHRPSASGAEPSCHHERRETAARANRAPSGARTHAVLDAVLHVLLPAVLVHVRAPHLALRFLWNSLGARHRYAPVARNDQPDNVTTAPRTAVVTRSA